MLEPNDEALLRRQLSLGDVVLFTGAGFSSGCKTQRGDSLPVGSELARVLWQIGFPNSPFDERSPLGEIFEVAKREHPREVREAFEAHLTIDSSTIPDWYRAYMHGPWHRIYTLNFDNFWDLAPMIDPEARQLMSISASADEPIPSNSRGEVVHLNGRMDEYPNITMSAQQYGERSVAYEKWYSQLVQDLYGHSIIFIGTELDESLLWEYIAMRKQRTSRTGEHRPRSFLVAPSISAPKLALLSQLNVIYVPGTTEEFSILVLEEMANEISVGSHALNARRATSTSASIIEDVAVLKSLPKPKLFEPTEFLRGRSPVWPDLQSGFMVERDFDKELSHTLSTFQKRILIVTGTVGTGKTCSLMQAAARLQEQGHRTMWFTASELPQPRFNRLLEQIRTAKPEYLFIDDGDSFGRQSGLFVSQASLNDPELTIVVGVRANRITQSGLEARNLDTEEITAPGLADSDIDLLIDALDAANRLGFLKGKTLEEQRRIFRKSFDRQLLVALLEATSDKRFEDLIKQECQELDGVAFDIYATASYVTSLGMSASRDELLLAVQSPGGEAVGELQRLIDRRLLVYDNRGLVKSRHRLIAEQTVDYLQSEGYLARIIEGIVYAVATKLGPTYDLTTRENKLLSRLINHQTLITKLINTMTIRPIYACVEDFLSSNYHYLLQRGSFEVEKGDIIEAKNFLAQARSLAPHDVNVQTEWAYMLMVEACSDLDQGLVSHRQHADEAFEELYDAIQANGDRNPYPYHILARQGTKWVEKAHLSNDERARYLARILEATKDGIRLHPTSSVLRMIGPEVERLYLLTGAKTEHQDGSAPKQ